MDFSYVRVLMLLFLALTKGSTAQMSKYWNDKAEAELNRAKNMKLHEGVAKNVILFLGDGLSLSTVTAARILKGQLEGEYGEESTLSFEDFPHLALSKTYPTDRQVVDSAASATAFLCGVKTKYYTVGVDDRVIYQNCSSIKGGELASIFDWSEEIGKSTGIVTTARITHASLSPGYAHAADRYWEGDAKLENVKDAENCTDIAYQLVHDMPGRDIEVLFGGGRRFFLNLTQTDPNLNDIDTDNQRRDGRDLIQEWKEDKDRRGKTSSYVWNKATLDSIDTNVDYALGLFQSSHLSYDLDRDTTDAGEPSLELMTRKAIEILKKNDKGYFLMVEAARIDLAHHDNLAKKAIYDTLAFDKAIRAGIEMTSEEDTLIVVTSDHSSPMAVAGYANRGTDIFGLVEPMEDDYRTPDNYTFTVLQYSNGPGYDNGNRKNLTNVDTKAKNYTQSSGVPIIWATHSGEDVAIYARGPSAHMFQGVHEQNYIAHVMAYASCVGKYDKTDCWQRKNEQCTSAAPSRDNTQYCLLWLILGIVYRHMHI